MKSIRIGNDIRIEWPIVLSGDVEKLKDLDLTVEVRPSAKIIDTHNYADENSRKEVTVMMNGGVDCLPDIGDGKEHCQPCRPRPHCPTAPVLLPYHIEDNTLIAMWTADRQFATGDYDIMLYAHKNEGGQAVCDQYRFVRLVSHTAEADAPDGSGIEAVIAMQPVTLELSGLSAYEVAVINGFQGTEEEWLQSLKQPAIDAAEQAKEDIEKYKTETKAELKADIETLGYYESNDEFIRVYTDAEGKFLWGIRVDGSIEWAKGVPAPVKDALKKLEAQLLEEGDKDIADLKAYIDAKATELQGEIDVINEALKPLTDTFKYEENEEFANVITDAEGKVLFGIRTDGTPYFPKNEMYKTGSNEEFAAVWLDAQDKVLFGVRHDGSFYVAKADFLDKIAQIQKILDENEIGDNHLSELVGQLQEEVSGIKQDVEALKPLGEMFSIISNEEWMHAVVDAENKLLFGIKAETGEIVMPKQDTYKIISNEEWMAVWVDASNKPLFGVKADGTFWCAKSNFSVPDDYVKQEDFENKTAALDEQIEGINTTISSMQQAVAELAEQVAEIDTSNEALKMLYVLDDVEGRTEMTLDADGRILSYRDKDGVKHEEKGIDTSKYYQNGQEKDFVNRDEIADEVTKAAENGAIKLENVDGVSNHNTPNLLIADEMQKTFNDGTNSFTPPNAGYEMSNPIECQAGDWFTRTGTATGMVVVTDADDKNGTRLLNADGTTLGNTFQVPTDMTWVRYIRMAAEVSGAENGSVVICKGKKAYTSENKGDFLTVDKLRIQTANIPKDIRYLKSPDGKYWEMYVDSSHQLKIREIDPNIITDLPADFPVYTISGDYGEYFDTWVSDTLPYLIERNKNGVINYHKVSVEAVAAACEFRKEKNLSGETRYLLGGHLDVEGPNGEKCLTIFDNDFNIIDTGITAKNGFNGHDFVFFNDDHVGLFTNDSGTIQVPIDKDSSGYVEARVSSCAIVELKKTNGVWNEIGRCNLTDYPRLFTDAFGIYSENETLEIHPNTLFIDYDGHYVLNLRNNDSWVKFRRTENLDGTVTIGSKTFDYDEAIIGRVGGKYNSGYIDPKRVLEEGFSFTDVPTNLHTRSTDEEPVWKFYHQHDVGYWGMKNIGGQNYPTYLLFDNNMWTRNGETSNYIDINPRNNYSNNPTANDESSFIASKSDDGGAYDTHMVSRVVQLSIDWENCLIKDYRVYIIPKQYSYTRSGVQMFNEGVLLISWADQKICGLYDFNDEQTKINEHVYENGKELFRVSTNGVGFYRVHGYKNN